MVALSLTGLAKWWLLFVVLFEWSPSRRKEVNIPLGIFTQNKNGGMQLLITLTELKMGVFIALKWCSLLILANERFLPSLNSVTKDIFGCTILTYLADWSESKSCPTLFHGLKNTSNY